MLISIKQYEERKKKKTHQKPKQHVWHHFGLFCCSQPSNSLLFMYIAHTAYIYNKILVRIKQYEERRKKNSPEAQTMHLLSFGPVLSFPALQLSQIQPTYTIKL